MLEDTGRTDAFKQNCLLNPDASFTVVVAFETPAFLVEDPGVDLLSCVLLFHLMHEVQVDGIVAHRHDVTPVVV